MAPRIAKADRPDHVPFWTKTGLPFRAAVRRRWRQVKAAILREPSLYDQNDWGLEMPGAQHVPTTCGSPACLAGWYYALSPVSAQRRFKHNSEGLIRRDTGLDIEITAGGAAAWPEPFRSQWCDALGMDDPVERRAQIAAARIDHLLKTGE